jgi:thioredoxin reductase (NADPH)
VLLIEKSALGGQAGVTHMLDNFPGFDEGISGDEFARRLGRQARRFGVEISLAQEVTLLKRDQGYLCFATADGSQYSSRAALLASGARYRVRGVEGEEELIGISIHFCATYDGAFYRGKGVLVIGGGNSGFEEGLFLTRLARQIDIVTNSLAVSASQILQDKVASRQDMGLITNHAIRGFEGDLQLQALLAGDQTTGEIKRWN